MNWHRATLLLPGVDDIALAGTHCGQLAVFTDDRHPSRKRAAAGQRQAKRRVSDIDDIRPTQAARTFGSSWMA